MAAQYCNALTRLAAALLFAVATVPAVSHQPESAQPATISSASVTATGTVAALTVTNQLTGATLRYFGLTLDQDLPLSSVLTNPTTEPRTGPTHQFVFTYDKALSAATAAVTEGTATASSSIVGSTVVVNLTGVTNKQYVTVTLSSVASTDGGTGGTGVARVGFLLGDVNQSRVVLLSDLVLVNAQLAKLVTSANFLKDVNANGTLTVGNIIITNANLAKALPAP